MKRNFLGLLTLGLAFSACNNSTDENLQLQKEVIAVHDSIMPKMGEFVRDDLKVSVLLSKMDSLKQVNPSLDTAAEKQQLENLQTGLKKTNEAMTDWMHEFDPAQENKKPEEVQTYLHDQLKKIQALKQHFSEVEGESQRVLEKYK